jgi:hypothetical protein
MNYYEEAEVVVLKRYQKALVNGWLESRSTLQLDESVADTDILGMSCLLFQVLKTEEPWVSFIQETERELKAGLL